MRALHPLLIATLLASSASPASAAAAGMRSTTALSSGWKFHFGDVAGAPEQPAFSDRDWSAVNVPHSWNRVGYYLDRPASHINRKENENKSLGVGWYRLRFVPKDVAGRQAWLEFDAASRTAEVWLNGVLLGSHRGGFSRFRLDATRAIRPGQLNVLAVKVDNSAPKDGSPTADTLPLTGDFFVYGGLYRPVRLITTDAVHIDMLDHGGPGVYATTVSIDAQRALVDVRARIRNEGAAMPARVTSQLLDAGGKVVASIVRSIELPGRNGAEIAGQFDIARPRLWQGTADPYLYTLRVDVRSTKGALLDRLDQPLGIRKIRIDPNAGLFLNGKHVDLHGVGFHQDREDKGWALDEKDVADSVATLREMGVNAIRLTHYQHGQPIHDLADRTGIILWDEIPLVTAWTTNTDQKSAPEPLRLNARQQLQELIRQNSNHASVAVWGIANEVDFGPGRPDFLGVAPKSVPDPLPLLNELRGLAKAEDPVRPSVLATCCEDRGMADVPITASAVDAAGANRYFGWYYGRPNELSADLDHLHAKRPTQPLALSEYGAGGAISLHSDDPLGGPIDMGGATQPEEYQSWLHEQTWRVLKTKPYLWAKWIWSGFDFATSVRREGDSQDINTKGLVTFHHRTRKDAFYFYKANWTTTPTIHIAGRRYVDRAYPATDVKVYSNAPSTELFVGGRWMGRKTNCPDRVCVWPSVRLTAGSNVVRAQGAFRSGPVRDEVRWTLAPQSARAFRIDSGAVIAALSGTRRFGSDAFFDGGAAGSADRRPRGRPAVLASIGGAEDRDIVATYREGTFSYRIPVEAGRYQVALTFVEPSKPVGGRVFDVLANGKPVVSAIDVAKEAGGVLRSVTRTVPVAVDRAGLDLRFEPRTGQAIVSAIEVTPLSK